MTITAHQRPLEATRSANKSCKWVAEAIVKGRTYTAISRMAAANDIARQLVADGIPDEPMQVYTAGLKGCLVWPSFHRAAERNIEENSQVPVRSPQLPSASGSTPRGAGRPKTGGKGSGRYSGRPRGFSCVKPEFWRDAAKKEARPVGARMA